MLYMNVEQIAKKAGVTKSRVYYIKRMIGHLPTVTEVKNYVPRKKGRPTIYQAIVEEEFEEKEEN